MTPEILASTIEAVGMIVAALITILGLSIASRMVLSRRQLRIKLAEAYSDLIVLQAIETVHVDMEIGRKLPSNKRKVRDIVAEEKGMRVSGNNSPAQVTRKLAQLGHLED